MIASILPIIDFVPVLTIQMNIARRFLAMQISAGRASHKITYFGLPECVWIFPIDWSVWRLILSRLCCWIVCVSLTSWFVWLATIRGREQLFWGGGPVSYTYTL